MMQQFHINRIKAGAVCSQSRPEANARIRNCISSTAPGDIFSHVSTTPRTSLILPADNSAASSSGASSWVNNTRRKSKVRRNIPCHVCFLSDYCLKWAVRWGGGLGPASLLKGPKKVQVSILVHACQRQTLPRNNSFPSVHSLHVWSLYVTLPEPQHLWRHSAVLQLLSVTKLSFRRPTGDCLWDCCQNTTTSN